MIHKKKIAAIAAVTRYLQSEQEQQLMSCDRETQQAHELPVPAAPQQAFNFWGGGGRSQQMQMRNLMQMKSFHRK